MFINIFFIFLISVGANLLLRIWFRRRIFFGGVILVTKEEDRTLFSLVLEVTPEELESKKTVIFKVETPE